MGTINGLARFDGVSFTVVNVLNTPALPGNTIVGLFEADDGTLLIVTDGGGIAAFRNGRFQRIQDPWVNAKAHRLPEYPLPRLDSARQYRLDVAMAGWTTTPLVTRRHRIASFPKVCAKMHKETFG